MFALMIGGMFPIIHLGRAWLFYWLIPYPNSRLLWPNFRSPLLWDLTAILTYMTGSVIYLYLPLIPDMAQLAEHNTPWRRKLYRALSLGWTGSDREWHALERAMKLMACIILAVAISVHTVVAWDFAMAIAPMWHSTIFGPYFVVGAIFSGIAALLIVMALIRKCMRLEQYLTRHHFNNLAKLLLLMSLLWFYFTMAENLTVWYGNEPERNGGLRRAGRAGHYAPYFWTMVLLNFVVPFVLLGIRRLRTITHRRDRLGLRADRDVAGALHDRGADAGQSAPACGAPPFYAPTWVELAITAATFAGDGDAVHDFLQAVPDHRGLGVQAASAGGRGLSDVSDRRIPREGVGWRRRFVRCARRASTAADMDLFSEEPVEFPRGVLDRPSHMSLVSVRGRDRVRRGSRPLVSARRSTTTA